MPSSTPSGIVSDIDSADIMSPRFIGFEPIHTGTYFNVVKAQRYGQWWALKYLREEHRDNNFFRNLLQKEYRIATRLNHPSIVRVVSLENVQPYGECIVMEYIDGVTLDKMPATSASRRYELMQQLVSAVASMHSLQIVHRDIKPHNIIVTNNGRNLRLIDLGLADADNYAVLKQPAGTDGYISPEQRTEAVPDAANDVYSLGVILKEQHLGWQFAYTVSKCLRPAARRYSDATQLGKALERARRINLGDYNLPGFDCLKIYRTILYSQVYEYLVGKIQQEKYAADAYLKEFVKGLRKHAQLYHDDLFADTKERFINQLKGLKAAKRIN